jgi:hypothetical protein
MRTFAIQPYAVTAAHSPDSIQSLRQGDGSTDDQARAIVNLHTAPWDGTERRQGDRRQQNRRQDSVDVLLDTRTSQDRRRQGRRATDQLPRGAFSFKA